MSNKYNWDYLLKSIEDSNIQNFHEKIQKDIYIFGAGLGGEKVRKALRDIADVSAFIDNDHGKVGSELEGLKIIGLNEIKDKGKQIIIASQWYKDITVQLEQEGFSNYVVYPFDLFEWDDYKIIKEFKIPAKVELYKNAYDALDDDDSKEIYIRMLMYRMTGERKHIKKSNYGQYLHPCMDKTKIENIIDAGAYDGDTIRLFQGEFKNFSHIYAFEPTHDKVIQINAEFNEEIVLKKNITVVEKGLWSLATTLQFEVSENASMTNKVSNKGDLIIPVVSIDGFLYQETQNNKIDFIKMDIEGSEVEAIRGGSELIIRDMPILAISIYHDVTHFHEVFDTINQLDIDYRYYVGHHKDVLFDTVIYAIPLEKLFSYSSR